MKANRCKKKSDPQMPQPTQETDKSSNNDIPALDASKKAAILIIQTAQEEAFAHEFNVLQRKSDNEPENRRSLKERRAVLRKSSLYRLDPFLDKDRILWVLHCSLTLFGFVVRRETPHNPSKEPPCVRVVDPQVSS